MEHKQVDLYGRVFVRGRVRAMTGLHIGGSPAALSIGSVDNPVIRDPVTGRPYIPGSSLRGKMRSLWEKMTGSVQNQSIGKGVHIHICKTKKDYDRCPVCRIYGVPGESDASSPTRLVVRDAFLSQESKLELEQVQTDLPYTEVKWEAAIDRVTSAATPRQMERVPARTLFDGLELVFSVYDPGDLERFLNVFEALQLVEDDYLGGQGARGSGKVRFEDLHVSCRARNKYAQEQDWPETEGGGLRVQDILAKQDGLLTWLGEHIKKEAYRPAVG